MIAYYIVMRGQVEHISMSKAVKETREDEASVSNIDFGQSWEDLQVEEPVVASDMRPPGIDGAESSHREHNTDKPNEQPSSQQDGSVSTAADQQIAALRQALSAAKDPKGRAFTMFEERERDGL